MLTRHPTYSSAAAQEEGGLTGGHVSASCKGFGSVWTVTLKGTSHIHQAIGLCPNCWMLHRQHFGTMCSVDGFLRRPCSFCNISHHEGLCCEWFQLQAVFAVSLLLLSLPQMPDFNSTESCWPSVWFSWSFCQQGNRDGSPLSVGGEVTPAATNQVAQPAFYFCLPVFQCLHTKHECFVNILIKDSSGFLFFPSKLGKKNAYERCFYS